MRTGIRWFLVSLAALGVAGGAAWAAQHEEGEGEGKGHHKRFHAKKFEKKDADGDGVVSLEEWMAASEKHFAELDADGSGTVTREEMKAAHQSRRERWKQSREEKDAESDS